MKFQISVMQEKMGRLLEYLDEHQVEVAERGDFLITEPQGERLFLPARDEEKRMVKIAAEDVVYIEAFGKEIEIHTRDGMYYALDRIYQLEQKLPHDEFLRVSKSVIISKHHLSKIRPALSMKYVLTMADGTLVDVTRSYYSEFRRFFGI